MPECCAHHMLDPPLLAVGKPDLGPLSIYGWLRTIDRAGTRRRALWASDRRCRAEIDRLAIPLRIAEVVMCFDEVVDREVVLAIVQPRSTADDLLELDHRMNRAHQNDVADVTRVNTGGKLLGRGQDRRDGLLVVLEVSHVLLTD